MGRRLGRVRAGILALSVLTCVGLVTLDATVAAAAPVGVDWTSQTSAADINWTSVAWGDDTFAAVASSGTTNQVMTSGDGITWALQSDLAGTQTWNSVTRGGPTGQELFVAVGSSGALMTSPTGASTTWTSRTFGSGSTRNFRSVTWGDDTFVAVADASSFTGRAIQYSPDGVTWTAVNSPDFTTWSSVAWGGPTGQEKFVAVAALTYSNKTVMTSADGLNWTLSASGADPNSPWKSVTWGGPAGDQKFVAVASDGRIMTSSTGASTTWTAQNPFVNYPWSSVAWGGPTGDQAFVAVATGGQVMTSPDGLTWTLQTAAASNNWNSVAWGRDKFAAVASTGINNRVMTSASTLTAPGSPVITGVSAGGTSAGVSFTADDSGGSAITRLEFALDDTTAVDDSTASLSSPYTLTGLLPGTSYSVYMRAVNPLGTGPWSTPQAFTTLSAPGIPVITGVSAGETSAGVSFTADDSGGSAITRLEFALDDTSAVDDSTSSLSSPYTLTGLLPGTSYSVYMRAVNAVGAGPWSTPQAFTTSSPPNPIVYPPSAPASVTAVGGDGSASVSWAAPSESGSFAISGYQVTAAPGGRTCIVSAAVLSCEVSGLSNGTKYTFAVRGLNGAGWGPWSDPSNAVTPSAPVVPSIVIVGSRDRVDTRLVRVIGRTTGLAGEQVTAHVRFAAQPDYVIDPVAPVVGVDGRFGWERRTARKTYVYFTHEGVRSNTVIITARR